MSINKKGVQSHRMHVSSCRCYCASEVSPNLVQQNESNVLCKPKVVQFALPGLMAQVFKYMCSMVVGGVNGSAILAFFFGGFSSGIVVLA